MARPKHLRRGRHRMTPARRAALKKAQAASARKRRRKDYAKAAGRAAVNIGGMFVAARISTYISRPGRIKSDYQSVKSTFSRKKPPQQPVVSKNVKHSMSWANIHG